MKKPPSPAKALTKPRQPDGQAAEALRGDRAPRAAAAPGASRAPGPGHVALHVRPRHDELSQTLKATKVKTNLRRAARRRALASLSRLNASSTQASRSLLASKRTKRCGGGGTPSTLSESQATVLRSDENGKTLRVKLPQLQFVSEEGGGKTFTKLVARGTDTLGAPGAPGAPGIPVSSEVIAVPDGAQLEVKATKTRASRSAALTSSRPDPVDQAGGQTEAPNFFAPPFAPEAPFVKESRTDGLVPASAASGRALGPGTRPQHRGAAPDRRRAAERQRHPHDRPADHRPPVWRGAAGHHEPGDAERRQHPRHCAPRGRLSHLGASDRCAGGPDRHHRGADPDVRPLASQPPVLHPPSYVTIIGDDELVPTLPTGRVRFRPTTRTRRRTTTTSCPTWPLVGFSATRSPRSTRSWRRSCTTRRPRRPARC